MRISINHLILIEEKYGTFEIGSDEQDVLTLRFGYWRQVPVDNLQSMFRSLTLNSNLIVEQNLVDEDEECGGELWNYKLYCNTGRKSQPTNMGVKNHG